MGHCGSSRLGDLLANQSIFEMLGFQYKLLLPSLDPMRLITYSVKQFSYIINQKEFINKVGSEEFDFGGSRPLRVARRESRVGRTGMGVSCGRPKFVYVVDPLLVSSWWSDSGNSY